MRSLILALAALAFAASAGATPKPAQGPFVRDSSGQCRDANGVHVLARLCHVPPQHCRDPNTRKIVKCGTPGAVPTH